MDPNTKTRLYHSMIISYIKGNFIKADRHSGQETSRSLKYPFSRLLQAVDKKKAWWATRFTLILPSARFNWKLNTVEQKDCIYIYKAT